METKDFHRARAGVAWSRGGRVEQAGEVCEMRFGGGRKPAGVADALKSFRQRALEKAAQELFAGQGAGALQAGAGLAKAESDRALILGEQARLNSTKARNWSIDS